MIKKNTVSNGNNVLIKENSSSGFGMETERQKKTWPYKGDSLDLEGLLPAAEPVSAFPAQIQKKDILKELCQSKN